MPGLLAEAAAELRPPGICLSPHRLQPGEAVPEPGLLASQPLSYCAQKFACPPPFEFAVLGPPGICLSPHRLQPGEAVPEPALLAGGR